VKCQPQSQILQAEGNIVHDCHAEVLALRAFNKHLLDELHRLAAGSNSSPFIRSRTVEERSDASPEPFSFEENVRIHMYSSDAPCGDASMELTMALQDDPTPWERVPEESSGTMLGRGDFSRLGIVRRKPCETHALAILNSADLQSASGCAHDVQQVLLRQTVPDRVHFCVEAYGFGTNMPRARLPALTCSTGEPICSTGVFKSLWPGRPNGEAGH